MIALKLSLMIFFHPIDSFNVTKRERNNINIFYSLLLYALAFVSQYFFIIFIHYPLSILRPIETNLYFELLKLIVPILSFVVASYAITTIMDGESHFTETFKAISFCLVPYILFMPILAITSNIMSLDEIGLFKFLQNCIFIWVIILIFICIKTLNDYSFSKTIRICILSIIAIAIMWALILLIFALTSQLFSFLNDLIFELRMLKGG